MKMPAESQQVTHGRPGSHQYTVVAELIDSQSNTGDLKVLNIQDQEAAIRRRVAAAETIQAQPDGRSNFLAPDQERSPSVKNMLSWPALPTTNSRGGEASPRTCTRDVSRAGKGEVRASFKDALEQGAPEAAAQPPMRYSPARPRKHQTQKRDEPRLERPSVESTEDDSAWFGAVGDAERDYSRRTRRSRQSSQSRDRRMALKAAGNHR